MRPLHLPLATPPTLSLLRRRRASPLPQLLSPPAI